MSWIWPKSELYIIALFLILFYGCVTINRSYKSGAVITSYRINEQGSSELIYPEFTSDTKTLFYNNYFIQAVPIIRTFDSAEIHNFWIDTFYYEFIDLNTRNYFRYLNFSDTALPIQCCYTTPDSLGIEGGWNFFYKPKKYNKPNIGLVNDTLINNVNYKMAITFKKDTLPDRSIIEVPLLVYYLNMDRNESIFTLNHFLTDSLGYPVTRFDLYDRHKVSGKKFTYVGQIEFVADTLSMYEKKVFKNWIETAKKNPAKYNALKDSIYTPPYPIGNQKF